MVKYILLILKRNNLSRYFLEDSGLRGFKLALIILLRIL